MNWLSAMPLSYRRLAGVALLIGAAGLGWLVQGWRLGEQMAEQGRELERQITLRDRLHADTLAEIQRAAADQVRRSHEKRLMLEQQLQASSQNQHRKLTDAEKAAAHLRDRLATAELRLSVLLANPAADSSSGGARSSTSAAGCLVDGAGRADIDSGSAQRIVGIVERGDRAIIALTACQAYVRKVVGSG